VSERASERASVRACERALLLKAFYQLFALYVLYSLNALFADSSGPWTCGSRVAGQEGNDDAICLLFAMNSNPFRIILICNNGNNQKNNCNNGNIIEIIVQSKKQFGHFGELWKLT
jgi:hypothetical protein